MENSVRFSQRSSIGLNESGTAVYRAELAWRVRELGYDLQAGKNGAPEIKGYSREYLEANSPRSQQIREYLKEEGLSGAGPAQIAAHRTREEKLPLDRCDVKALHMAVAEGHGNQPSRVVQRLVNAAPRKRTSRPVTLTQP